MTKDVFDGNKERVNLNEKEEIKAFLNEFSGLKLKKSKDMGTFSMQYTIQIMSDDVHLEYVLLVFDNNHISIHHYSQNSNPVVYEIINDDDDDDVNLEKFFQ